MADLFENQKSPASVPRSNVPEMTVTQLAFSLRQTLEETYGRVRVKGELSGLKLASSGHLYGDLKDEEAVVNIVCWRGTLSKLKLKPEDGMDVVVTGKVSSYPKSSRYQIIVDSIELGGVGALLKMLEERKKKLAAEGLFDAARKKPLPYLPDTIGVITSPTGAVIRDILHRLADRFPRHVLLWPVAVQGEGAAEQIAAAIRGFESLKPGGALPRPDVLIVARGGGSFEDLMAFNEEIVVRAVADCTIPLISAVGHETDTTLIDFAADVRAPTPTAAAEMAVPVRAELYAQVLDAQRRIVGAAARFITQRRERLFGLAARLGDPHRLLELKNQRFDHAAHRLDAAFERGLKTRETRLVRAGAALRHPRQRLSDASQKLALRAEQLDRAGKTLLRDLRKILDHTARMLESLSFERVLERGYAVVRGANGAIVSDAETALKEQTLEIQFRGGRRVGANVRK